MRLFSPVRPLNYKPTQLTVEERSHGIRITQIESAVATTFSILVGGTFFNALVLKMGANAYQFGLLTSLLPLSTLLQCISPWLQDRVDSRRRLLLALVIPDRFLLWSVILVPVLLPKDWWIWTLLGIIFLRSLTAQLNGLVYQDWLADLIPIEQRNSYWGVRYTLNGIAGIVAPFCAGWILDQWNGGLKGFYILYLLTFPLMIIDLLLFLYQDEPLRQTGNRVAFRDLFNTLQVKQFRRYLLFFGAWTLLQSIVAPYTTFLMFRVHHLPYTFVSQLTVLSTLISTIFYIAWSKWQDRFGIRRVYQWVLPALAIVSSLWTFASANNHLFYIIIFLLTGGFTAATSVGNFNLLLSVIPASDRFRFLTFNSLLIGIIGFLASNMGAFIIDFLAGAQFIIFIPSLTPLQQMFFLDGIGSLFLALAFGKMVKPLT